MNNHLKFNIKRNDFAEYYENSETEREPPEIVKENHKISIL